MQVYSWAFLLAACHHPVDYEKGSIQTRQDTSDSSSVYIHGNDYAEPAIEDIVIDKIPDTSMIFDAAGNCAVFIQYSDKEADSLKKENEEDFETASNDMGYFAADAAVLLRQADIPDLWTSRRFIYWREGKEKYIIDTRKADIAGWYLVLFGKGQKPLLVQTMDLTEQIIKDYYTK